MYKHRFLHAYLLQNVMQHQLHKHLSNSTGILTFSIINIIHNYPLNRTITVWLRQVNTTFKIDFLADANKWGTAYVGIAIQTKTIFLLIIGSSVILQLPNNTLPTLFITFQQRHFIRQKLNSNKAILIVNRSSLPLPENSFKSQKAK